MYCMRTFFSGQQGASKDSKRKEARYELATLLTHKRFKDARSLADSYLSSSIIRPEDHAFVFEIACLADSLLQDHRD